MNKDFLLEIGLEEMPAQYVTSSAEQLKQRLADWLKENKIKYDKIELYSTPRRLAVILKNVSEKQENRFEEAKGPTKKIALDENNNWTKAALGFAHSQNITTDELTFKEIKGVDYIYIKKEITGKNTKDLLQDVKSIVEEMNFPVAMHWGEHKLRYIRPIKWLIALFDDEVIPFEITGVKTDRFSYGHRFLGSKIKITFPAEYPNKLKEQYVIPDAISRKQMIYDQIKEFEVTKNWHIPIDEELLEEVNNLIEYPTLFSGSFDAKYLALPKEILITSMKEHQRYFSVFDQNRSLLPHFVAVRNGNNEQLETVIHGNEKVLRARLADSEFFYQEDLKVNMDECLRKLNNIIYHEKLGTVTEKMRRVQNVALMIANFLGWTDEKKKDLRRVTTIYKFDLVTNIVREFPELQGIIGEKYARIHGEKEVVAQAIREHYRPISAEGDLPKSDLGALLAISDKLETIISFFCINIMPSGSADPYGLRRNAFGVMRIIQANDWNFPLTEIISNIIALECKEDYAEMTEKEVKQSVQAFLTNRLRVILTNNNIRRDIIEALTSEAPDLIPSLIERAKLLNENVNEEWFRPTIESLTRVLNIAKKNQQNKKVVNPNLFENDYEEQLFEATQKMVTELPRLTLQEVLTHLIHLRPVINAYFDHTMVMNDDENLKDNRLALLSHLAICIKKFADVDKINVK